MKVGAAVERIYVSWTEQWEMARYVDHYLTARNYVVNDESRAAIRMLIAHFKPRPLKKGDLDFFLDANVHKKLKLESEPAPTRGDASNRTPLNGWYPLSHRRLSFPIPSSPPIVTRR